MAGSRKMYSGVPMEKFCSDVECWMNDLEILFGIRVMKYSKVSGRWATASRAYHPYTLKEILLADGRFLITPQPDGSHTFALSPLANKDNYTRGFSKTPDGGIRQNERQKHFDDELTEQDRKMIALQRFIREEKGKTPGPDTMQYYWGELYPGEPWPG